LVLRLLTRWFRFTTAACDIGLWRLPGGVTLQFSYHWFRVVAVPLRKMYGVEKRRKYVFSGITNAAA
jgi:hypothetical protein